MTDPERLEALAEWIEENGAPWDLRSPDDTEVEDDLRRIAARLREIDDV